MVIFDEIGFAIVEMYVVMAVMVVIASISIPNLTRFINRLKVNSPTNALTSRLRLTRQKAITTMSNYVFDYNLSQNSYWMYRDQNENWSHDSGEEFFGSYEACQEHLNVTFDSDNSLPNPVAFTSKGSIIAQDESPAYGDFVFYNTRGDIGRIVILPSGFIKSNYE
jgi:Tfp pilus assembly protein FimT